MSLRAIFAIVATLVILVVGLFSVSSLFENVDAGEIVVIQSPVSGKLAWHTVPGIKWQGFGKVTTYHKRSQYWFNNEQRSGVDQSLKVRFNDGGHAVIAGGVSWELPLDHEQLAALHTRFTTQSAIEQQLIRTVVEKSIYMTGPHMSSTESYAGRRSELLQLIEDQAQNGILLTRSKQYHTKDELTGIDKTITTVEIEKDEDGVARRSTDSPLSDYGVRIFNLSINSIDYEDRVEEQIRQQQQSTMAVQIAIADAKRAEQQVLTTEKEGEAAAAKAEWEQKAIAAKAEQEALMNKNVAETKAQQELEVAKLATLAAEQKKLAEIALGEGESQRRKLVMEADGALEKKLQAFIEINAAYAQAMSNYGGAWVPSVVMGGQGSEQSGSNGATDLINLLMVKTARDLSLDLDLPSANPQK